MVCRTKYITVDNDVRQWETEQTIHYSNLNYRLLHQLPRLLSIWFIYPTSQ